MKILIAVLAAITALSTGCAVQQGSDEPGDPAADLRPMIYPPESLKEFPEEQVIKKELQVTTQWQTVTFEKPLQINRRGLMGLHLVVDQAPYISTMDDHPLNPECNKPECAIDAYSLRRLSNGTLVRPEAVLVGDKGEEVRIRPGGHLYPFFDHHVMTMALRYFKDINAFAPPFPEGIQTFTSMRIRSTTPFQVRYLWWSVDRYPYRFKR